MGFYREHVLPRVVDASLGSARVAPLRRRVCAGLAGDVVEIGFGSGLNVPAYPGAVHAVAAVEPRDLGWRLARRRVGASSVIVDRIGLDGQALPLPDASQDAALSTFTLCTVPDPELALRELRRVLKPGAPFHFLEHGSAPDAAVRRWQSRLDPLQQRIAGGCHLTRPIADLVSAAGFEVTALERSYLAGAPKVLAALTLGTATSPREVTSAPRPP